jgi:hypothetical protein
MADEMSSFINPMRAVVAYVSCTLNLDPKTKAESKTDLDNFAICCERHDVTANPIDLYEVVLLLRSLYQKVMNGDVSPMTCLHPRYRT